MRKRKRRINLNFKFYLMAVKNINEHYRCNVCGNETTVTEVGGGTLVCCEEEMELMEEAGSEEEGESEEEKI